MSTIALGMGFPGGSVEWLSGKESVCSARDADSVPGSGRTPEVGSGSPLQYSCLGNAMDRVASWATVHGITKS